MKDLLQKDIVKLGAMLVVLVVIIAVSALLLFRPHDDP